MRAEIVAIGDEIVHGQVVDTNSAWLAAELEQRGAAVARISAAGDAPAELEAVLREACARADVVVVTGGLGPTEDDRTRSACAAVAKAPLVFDAASWTAIEAWFGQRGRVPSESNRRQAMRPTTARVLENRWGTAPGFALKIGRAELLALPGVPSEMRAMFGAHVAPWVEGTGRGGALAFARFLVVGPPESELGERLADVMRAGCEPSVGITVNSGVLSVRIAARGASPADAQRRCAESVALIRPRLGQDLVAETADDLHVHCARQLIARGITLATAESCTGGLAAALLTAVPGVSASYLGGFVAYSAARKRDDLGVSAELIEVHGEVSEPVAAAMARGAAARAGARIGASITGIAGPDGGTPEKPVGLVCFGLADGDRVRAWSKRLAPIGREFVRQRAASELFAAIVRDVAGSAPA